VWSVKQRKAVNRDLPILHVLGHRRYRPMLHSGDDIGLADKFIGITRGRVTSDLSMEFKVYDTNYLAETPLDEAFQAKAWTKDS